MQVGACRNKHIWGSLVGLRRLLSGRTGRASSFARRLMPSASILPLSVCYASDAPRSLNKPPARPDFLLVIYCEELRYGDRSLTSHGMRCVKAAVNENDSQLIDELGSTDLTYSVCQAAEHPGSIHGPRGVKTDRSSAPSGATTRTDARKWQQ
jgi:hypothetical protein